MARRKSSVLLLGLVERDLRAKDLGFLLEFLVPVVNRQPGHI